MRPPTSTPRIFTATLLVIVAVPVAVAVLLVLWHGLDLRSTHDARARHHAQMIADSVSRVPAAQRHAWLNSLVSAREDGLDLHAIRIVGLDGQVLIDVRRAGTSPSNVHEARAASGHTVQLWVTPVDLTPRWLWSLTVALTLSVAAALAYYIAMRPVSSSIVATLDEVTRALQTFRQSNFSARVAEKGFGRFRGLERAVNDVGRSLEAEQSRARQSEDLTTEELQSTLEEVEIKNVELDLARKRALDDARSKSRFLANMSHEIRTPMNSIVGYSTLLKATQLDEAQQGYADSIGQSAATLLDIIDDILSLARLEAGKLVLVSQEFDIRRIVRQSVDMLAPMAYQKGLTLRTLVEPDLPKCFLGDALRIRQILVNLLSNAVKYTERGRVDITVRNVRQAGRNAVLFLGVRDTGRGISREDRSRLFEAFTDASRTERQGGAGLGLTITRALTTAMGGQLSLESEVNAGSTFLVRLPLKTDYDQRYAFLQRLSGRRVLLGLSDDVFERNLIANLGAARIELAGQATLDALLESDDLPECDAIIVECAQDRLEALDARWPAGAPPGIVLVPTADHRALNRAAQAVRGEALPAYAGATHVLAALARRLGIDVDSFEAQTVQRALPHVAGARALIADDDRLGRTWLKELLTQHGVEVTACADGQQAIAIARDVAFDIVFMDARMPLCDGVEATRRIRSDSRNTATPIVALTASALADDRTAFARAGMSHCLVKPADPEQILDLVAQALGDRRPAAAGTINGAAAHIDGEMRAMLRSELRIYRQSLTALREAFDEAELLHVAHRLHGAAAICALPALEAESEAVELALRGGETDAARERIDALLAAVDETIAATSGGPLSPDASQ